MSGWANEITVLSVREAIRKRAHMYVGPLDELLPNRLLLESLCRSLPSGCQGHAKSLVIDLWESGKAAHEVDGPGWPNEVHEAFSKRYGREVRIPEILMMELAACRDMSEEKLTCNHGMVTVNALSKSLLLENYVDGGRWKMTFFQGLLVDPYERQGRAEKTGTLLNFHLDPEIMPHVEFVVPELLVELAKVRPSGLEIRVRDNRTKQEFLVA
jgi:DNA gyrase/topoisomerase IV subunit B